MVGQARCAEASDWNLVLCPVRNEANQAEVAIDFEYPRERGGVEGRRDGVRGKEGQREEREKGREGGLLDM